MIIALIAFGVATPSISSTALIGAIPLAAAALGLMLLGVETRNKRLEEITTEEYGRFRAIS